MSHAVAYIKNYVDGLLYPQGFKIVEPNLIRWNTLVSVNTKICVQGLIVPNEYKGI